MTDFASAGSGQPGNPAGSPIPSPPASPGDGFASGLRDEGNRRVVEAKGWKDADTAIRSYTELERRLTDMAGRAVAPPPADAKPEQWDAFYARLGRPDHADGYRLTRPEGLSETMGYDEDGAAQFRQWSHAAGLTPRQAQSLHDAYVRNQAERHAAHTAAHAARGEQAHGELTRTWGASGSADYAENLGYANRFIHNNGGAALLGELRDSGAIAADGTVLSPHLVKALARAGRALYAEDGLVTGSPAPRPADPANTLYPHDPFAPRR